MEHLAPRKARSRERRTELLDAARRLFFENGYRGTTIEQIARAAGYSKRTVYLDYPTKDEIFITLCMEGGDLLEKRLGQIPFGELSVERCIERFIEVFTSFSREHPQYFRMIFSEATPAILAGCSSAVRERAALLERDCLLVVVGLVDRAVRERIIEPVDPWETAGILVGAATGIALLSMGGSQTIFSSQALESLMNKALWTCWRGLRVAVPGGQATGDP